MAEEKGGNWYRGCSWGFILAEDKRGGLVGEIKGESLTGSGGQIEGER